MRSALMKTVLAAVFAGVFFTNAYAQGDMQAFNAEVEQIVNHVEAGKIGRSEGAREMLAASKAFFPDDRLMHAWYESQVGYLERLERGEITNQQAQELFEIRTQRYIESVRSRDARIKAERSAEAELQRQQEDRRRAELEHQLRLAHEAEMERQRVEGNARLLRSIGDAFRNAYGR